MTNYRPIQYGIQGSQLYLCFDYMYTILYFDTYNGDAASQIYRPISLQVVFWKILETLILNRLNQHLQVNKILVPE